MSEQTRKPRDDASEYQKAIQNMLARITQLERERDAATRRAEEAEHHLASLLAVIHRDGGHYQQAHGTNTAVSDAMKISSERIVKIEEAEGAVKVLAEYAAALLEHSADLNDPASVDKATRIKHVEDVNRTDKAANANPIASAALAATVRKEGT